MSLSLSPLDMLDMSDAEQYILRCLNRQPGLTAAEIAKSTRLPIEEIEPALRDMVGRAQLVEQLQDGKRVFSVRFGRLQGRMLHLPSHLLDILKEDPDTFLEEASLTSLLSPKEREALLARSITRHVLPNEVIVWQGDRFKQVGLVRMGLMKKSRIKRGQRKQAQAVEYVRRLEWFGLSEVLSEYSSLDTYTAVTDSELLVWPIEEFMKLLEGNPRFSIAIGRLLSQQLQQCQNQRVHGAGRLWVIESLEKGAGATTLAANLALLVARNSSSNGSRPRVVLWSVHNDTESVLKMIGATEESSTVMRGQTNIIEHDSGVDLLVKTEQGSYPPQVQLDITLTDLQNRYDYIICDTGHTADDELVLRLRGLAEPLITLTRQPDGASSGINRWNTFQAYAKPAQKRFLALSQAAQNGIEVDPAFHLVLPYDPETVQAAEAKNWPVIDARPEGLLSQALQEVYRRLSLNHSIGIFVPSTMSVDQNVDNQAQVQAALSFLGGLFGGATSSNAEGVWQSTDGNLVVEQVTIVKTFVSKKALEQYLDDVIGFATQLKKDMRQEAVAIDVDNQLILV
jgi:hypothetical protein